MGRGACDACVYAYSCDLCDLCVVVAKGYRIIRKVDVQLKFSGGERGRAAKEIGRVEKVDARRKPRNGGAGKENWQN